METVKLSIQVPVKNNGNEPKPTNGNGSRRAIALKPTYVRDPHPMDLPWKIVWNPDTCIRCGSCVSTCTFGAIQAELQKQGQTFSTGPIPKPVDNSQVILAIKQVSDPKHFCRGCSMCEKVCPTNSIRPVANEHHRFPLLARQGGTPIKRGGRAHHVPVRVLDYIKVGRISQMTDPSLDAARHTFDLLTPFGRGLPADQLPLRVENGKLVEAGWTPPLRWIYPVAHRRYVGRRALVANVGSARARRRVPQRRVWYAGANVLPAKAAYPIACSSPSISSISSFRLQADISAGIASSRRCRIW
jgi:ferredoxin